MNDTLTPEQKQALLAAIPKIEQAGGLKWYPWCDIEDDCITDPRNREWIEYPSAYCPPAVAAAVIAWTQDLIEWWWTKSYCTLMPDEVENGTWCYRLRTLGGAQVGEQATGKLAASVALISAVAERLEGA